jgi:branched-chain amino acid transport system ATP-binding protein
VTIAMTQNGKTSAANALVEARDVNAGYNEIAVVRNLNLIVHPGEVVALIGSNGAGKTTTLLTLSGDLPPLSGEVLVGGVVTNEPLHKRARSGLSFVTEERSVFMRLTVAENLRVARCPVEQCLEFFPELEALLQRKAGSLSGGEQQMLTLARAIARNPKLLLVDELSLGLAPLIVERLLTAVREVADKRRIGVLMVEQHVRQALEIADRGYVMRRGTVQLNGPSSELLSRLPEIEASYLSGGE